MAKEKKKPEPSGYDKHRERVRKTDAAESKSGRDIFDDRPDCAEPDRRRAALESLEFFCRTYFPLTFHLPWSNDHRTAITLIERAVKDGGRFAYAMPRGSGKTTLAEAASLWATLFGFRRFVVPIGSDQSSSLEMLESIKVELESNDLLDEDFHWTCHPVRQLEGIAHRCNGQLWQGDRTHIHWTNEAIVLPTIPGSLSSGAILTVAGITGRIRGMKFKRPDGKSARPDLAILDDPQTDESARSPSQVSQRERLISGAVMGLAGPGQKIAAVMPCTVIAPDDLADRFLNRDKHPEWQGERAKLVYAFPTNTELWERYIKIRADGQRAGNGGTEGTEFYRANREQMDAGSQVAWPARHNPDELSALQHAINLRADLGERAFFAEYQNDPIPEEGGTEEYLTADQIAAKLNGHARGSIPHTASKLVVFVDVQKTALPWAVCAFEDDFTGYVIDYGFFPEQNREYFSLADAKRTLAVVLKTKSTEEGIYQGLGALAEKLLGREWKREDGVTMRVDRCCVDANWGESTDVVYQFCRESPFAAQLVPTHGRYIGAAGRAFGEYKAKPGDEIGDHWRRPVPQNRRAVRYGLFDANYWKTFVQERLSVSMGGRGCLSLFGEDAQQHRLFADHLTSENGVKVTAREKTVTEWKIKPARPDNHWLDCIVGCCVTASMLRVSLAERKQQAPQQARRVKLSDLQRKR